MKYIKLFLVAACLVSAYGLIRDYFDAPKRRQTAAQVANFEKLEKVGVKTHAILNTSYRESHIRVRGFWKSKIYWVKYFFTVQGFSYDGIYKTKEIPEERAIVIYYLPENPKINAVNPVDVLRELKSTERRFYAGIFVLVLAVQLFYSAMRPSKKPQPAR